MLVGIPCLLCILLLIALLQLSVVPEIQGSICKKGERGFFSLPV